MCTTTCTTKPIHSTSKPYNISQRYSFLANCNRGEVAYSSFPVHMHPTARNSLEQLWRYRCHGQTQYIRCVCKCKLILPASLSRSLRTRLALFRSSWTIERTITLHSRHDNYYCQTPFMLPPDEHPGPHYLPGGSCDQCRLLTRSTQPFQATKYDRSPMLQR